MSKQNDIEDFKIAITSTAKSISENQKLQIKFGSNEKASLDNLNIPNISDIFDKKKLKSVRALTDSQALRMKYSDVEIFNKYKPNGNLSSKLYDLSERMRCEKLGSDYYFGIEQNLKNFYNSENTNPLNEKIDYKIEELFEDILKDKIFGIDQKKNNNKIDKKLKSLSSEINQKLKGKSLNYNDQTKFNHLISDLLNSLELGEEATDELNESSEDNKNDSNQNNEQKDDQKKKQSSQDKQIEATLPDFQLQGDEMKSENLEAQNEEFQDSPNRRTTKNLKGNDQNYKVFTTKFDEIVKANDLENEIELSRLRKNLDQQQQHLKNFISKLANKLQRKLLALQNRSWKFDLDEGILDTSKLSRVIVDPLNSLSFKKEKDTKFKDTVVTLLIDNSGSMRGKPITVAAICADILAKTLERCSVKVEILGFTTKNWKGGKSREEWTAQNKPMNPGRLNDLRHIIYKSADVNWRQAKNNLGLMLKEGILKENIDGEALNWAYKRLTTRKEERKILLVISDGAPVDDSTLSANFSNYLENNLRKTIKSIENDTKIELLAIGIGHDVSRYYAKAIKISDVNDLGDTIVNQLSDLFTSEKITFH
jgi:cobaltochelatase CobT